MDPNHVITQTLNLTIIVQDITSTDFTDKFAISLYRENPIITEESLYDDTEVLYGEIGAIRSYEINFVDPLMKRIEDGEVILSKYMP